MKPSLFLILSVLLFLGCDKALELKDPVNVFSVSMNGKPWEDNPPPLAKGQVLRHGKKIEGYNLKDCQGTIILIRMMRQNYENDSNHLEELSLNGIHLKLDKFQGVHQYPLCSQDTLASIQFYHSIGGDVAGKLYSLLPSYDNFISIESIDETEGIVTGSFQAAFLNKDDEKDSVFFTDGRFQVMLTEL